MGVDIEELSSWFSDALARLVAAFGGREGLPLRMQGGVRLSDSFVESQDSRDVQLE
jgi:hypothetical protein